MKTINGKQIDDMFSQLRACFSEKDVVNHDSRTCISASALKLQFDKLISPWNWSFELKSDCTCIGDGTLIIGGTLCIRTDDGCMMKQSVIGRFKVSDVYLAKSWLMEEAAYDLGIQCDSQSPKESPVANSPEVDDSPKAMNVKVISEFLPISTGGASCKVNYNGQEMKLMIWKEQWVLLNKTYPDRFAYKCRINTLKFEGCQKAYKGKPQLHFIKLKDK